LLLTGDHIPDDLYNLTAEVPLTLQNSHYTVADSVPYLSNVVNVACLHCRPAMQLNSDLESFLRRGNIAGVLFFPFHFLFFYIKFTFLTAV